MFKPKAAAKPSEQDGKAADAAPAAPPVPRSGYATWVSEIMLQQTRVEAVIPHFLRWMERFPTAQSLADAPEEDAVALWAGLGYYRRARLLHKGARHVRDALGGQLPTTVEGLKEVPGIGDYTAGAVASIAFDKQAPIVDGNVIRVVARLAARPGAANDPDLKRYSWAVASALVPPAPARHGKCVRGEACAEFFACVEEPLDGERLLKAQCPSRLMVQNGIPWRPEK